MFSFIPPVVSVNIDKAPRSMIKACKIYHSVVNDESYSTRGEKRKKQTHCIFHYTIKGSGEVLYKGIPYRTKQGEGFFNIVNEDNSGYGYPENAKEPWEFVVICFEGGAIREITKELMEKRVVYSINNENSFLIMCKKLLEDGNTDIILTFFQRLVAMIYNETVCQSMLTKKFKSIVERELLNNPTISAIADEMNISREHLQREFIKENGISPAKHLNLKRFEKLCYLLTTPLKEAEISRMMNFPSLSGMILFFKKHSGITPGEYRKKGYISI